MAVNRPPLSHALLRVGVLLASAVFGAAAWGYIAFAYHGDPMTRGTLIVTATLVATAGMVWGAMIPGLTVKAFPTNAVFAVTVLLVYAAELILWQIVAKVALPFGITAFQMVFGLVRLRDLALLSVLALTVVSAGGVAFSRSIIYSAFSLLFTLLGVGGLYIFLSAPFLAVTQLLIYVGGILVLILFAIMLTGGIGDDPKITNLSIGLPAGGALGAAITALLVFIGVAGPWKPMANPVYEETTARLGDAFLTEYLLPFEIASVVLLAALVGAVIIARKELKEDVP